jgi:glycosyltransferase involved in cell wall biosynthesis
VDIHSAGNIEEFEVLAKEKGVVENIKFTGPVSDLEKWKYLFESDFYCLPSYAEGQPISIIEAMSIGLPVISTTVGSIPEMITDSTNGILIPAGDMVKLVEAIKKMSNKAFRLSIGEKAREIAMTRYDQSQFFASLVKIYTSLEKE